MISIEFGKAELLNLDKNSMFIKIFGSNFNRDKDRIKGYWNRIYHKDTHEWEIPFCCFKDIQEMFKDSYIKYLNEPPKARTVTNNEIINGMDFNGFYPYDYQLEGVNYMLNHPNSLLLDEQRIRKNTTNHNISKIQKITSKSKTLFNNMWYKFAKV